MKQTRQQLKESIAGEMFRYFNNGCSLKNAIWFCGVKGQCSYVAKKIWYLARELWEQQAAEELKQEKAAAAQQQRVLELCDLYTETFTFATCDERTAADFATDNGYSLTVAGAAYKEAIEFWS